MKILCRFQKCLDYWSVLIGMRSLLFVHDFLLYNLFIQLDLLFRMTNAVNVEFIVEKLLSFLATATDDHFRTDLVGQITQCAERFAPSNAWYVQTIIRVFELAGDKVKSSVAQTLTQLIAEVCTSIGGCERNVVSVLFLFERL